MSSPEPSGADVVASSPKLQRLLTTGFVGLLLTQFFGAFLDNLFRWFAVSVAQEQMKPEDTLMWGTLSLMLPFILLTPTAGWLADRFPKKRVIVSCKLLEFLITALAVISLATGNLLLMFTVVGLLGAQSALFGPAKFGSLAEIFPVELLARANGMMQLVSMTAIIVGGIAGYGLYDTMRPGLRSGVVASGAAEATTVVNAVESGELPEPADTPSPSSGSPRTATTRELVLLGGTMLLVALIGTGGSLCIPWRPAADVTRRAEINPLPNLIRSMRALSADVRLYRTAWGIAFFFFMGALAQNNLDQFGPRTFGISKTETGFLLGTLIFGVGVGSLLAGYWSDGKVELGIVPLGAIGIILSSLAAWLSGILFTPGIPAQQQWMYYCGIGSLFLLGTSAGLYNVPLESYLQFRSDPRTRGTVLSGSYFLSFSMGIVAAIFLKLLLSFGLASREVFLVSGLLTIPVTAYLLYLLPDLTFRFLLWLLTHTIYRLKVVGRDNIPDKGGALIVANHVSFMDGILMLVSTSRLARFVVFADFTEMWGLRSLAKLMKVIPIRSTDGPKSILKALQTAREAIINGEVVVIFAEGQLTRTGQMQPFARGMLKIVDGTGAPIIPAYLHGMWGSIFSFRGGKVFWKWPQQWWPNPITVRFGKPIYEPKDAPEVRRAVEELGMEEMTVTAQKSLIPARKFIRNCKRNWKQVHVVDSAGTKLTGGTLLIGSLAMRRVLLRSVLSANEQNVGVLLPPSAGGCLANMALALAGRTAVNLNYTLTDDVINFCIKKAGIRHVLTSKRFLEKKPFAVEGAELVFLEDLKEQITALDKAICAALAYLLPSPVLDLLLGLHRISPQDVLTIVFTSGSTGIPKGVVLTHANVGSNIDAVDQLLQLTAKDGILGVLPFFHSFGYTACMWLPMCYSVRAAYHFNPLDAKIVGRLVQDNSMTILMATPTFLKMYIKRVDKEQFASLDMVVVGAEKMPLEVAEAFKEKFGFTPSEGYGTTELSPVAAVNIPDHRSGKIFQQGTKLGTVGRTIPGVLGKVVDPETGEDLGLNREGLLLIKGPNVMQGYLDEPEKTAEVIRDGWYVTGDYASIDNEGFVTITGRQSRFSKIGGEMVPHIRIEEELTRLATAQDAEDDGTLKLAVTSVADPNKGERLIVLHRPLAISPEELVKQLAATGVPNLWLPSANSFYEVPEIPILGSGKLDLKQLKATALELTGQSR
jgi:acyl-[acyl-carrier-protein]-phospholipid O-acyltransferase/long-chain-fatty-acid--[acyl-carrier-protein] ligase